MKSFLVCTGAVGLFVVGINNIKVPSGAQLPQVINSTPPPSFLPPFNPAPAPSPTVSIPPFKGEIREVGEGRRYGDQSNPPDGTDNPAAMPYVNNVYPATVKILGRGASFGSGVSIDPTLVGRTKEQGAVILTCAHIINSRRMRVETSDKRPVEGAKVIGVNKEIDVAVITTQQSLPIAPMADTAPGRGTPIWVIGFPQTADEGERMTISPDSVILGTTNVRIRGDMGESLGGPPYLAIHEGTATHGNSGGPVVGNNQVIGLLEGVSIEEVAIPIEKVRKYLDQLKNGSAQADRQ